jgi:hypothetical protein
MPPAARRLLQMRETWEALGILNWPDDQAYVFEIALRLYAPMNNNFVFDGYVPRRFIVTVKPELLMELHYQTPHLRGAVRDHVPDESELGLRLYDLIRFKRKTDPAWLHILPEWGFLQDTARRWISIERNNVVDSLSIELDREK